MASTPYPLRISDEQKERIKTTAAQVNLPVPEVMRQAIDFGLPILKERLSKKPAEK